MSNSEVIKLGGWGNPGAAKKWHYFEPENIISICGRWMYTGYRETGRDLIYSPDDCIKCRSMLDRNKRLAKVKNDQ